MVLIDAKYFLISQKCKDTPRAWYIDKVQDEQKVKALLKMTRIPART